MNLTEEQILALAPDESSKKSGKDLANPSKWVTRGINETAAWGECQGSGSKPYQTQVDLVELAFKCSCPSRKFPCKHGLGLLILAARQPALFTDTEHPSWVKDWIEKRAATKETKEIKAAAKEDKPVDEAGQAKRQQARQQKVKDGTAELLLWIKDIIRGGLLNVPSKPASWWENMSKRMVDAQAPGLAGAVRSLGNTNFFREGWQTEFLEQLIRIYLIIKGYEHSGSLDEFLQADIYGLIGFTVSQEELKTQSGVLDDWIVLGKQSSEDQGITTEKFWLYGIGLGSYALVLQFLVRGQGAQLSLTPGMTMRAELVFFPSATPLRAVIKRQMPLDGPRPIRGFEGWTQLDALLTEKISLSPFYNERPYIVEKLIPVQYNQRWWLQDRDKKLMPVREGFEDIWKIVALSGGEPLDMALIGRSRVFEPIGIWQQSQYKII